MKHKNRNRDRADQIKKLAACSLSQDLTCPGIGYHISPLHGGGEDQMTEAYGFYIDFFQGLQSSDDVFIHVCVGTDISGEDVVSISGESFDTLYVPASAGIGSVLYTIGEAVMACRASLEKRNSKSIA